MIWSLLSGDITFAYPWLLLLLGLPIWWLWRRYISLRGQLLPRVRMRVSSAAAAPPSLLTRLQVIAWKSMLMLQAAALCLLIVALARPRTLLSDGKDERKGIDIILAMDISRSMEKNDFKPNRLEASRKVALEFIDGRPDDRIGLVIFSGESFTLCPLTLDHRMVKTSIMNTEYGLLEDGTAIGMGLATAVDRLRKSSARAKVVILLTDGANNAGKIDPYTAAALARKYKIKVYTIGMAGASNIPMPYRAMGDVEIDEPMMKAIAEKTGGRYFRAVNNDKLSAIYKEINSMERTRLHSPARPVYREDFGWWVRSAGAILSLVLLLRLTWLRSLSQ